MGRLLEWARLSFKLQRLEILILSGAVLIASALMLWFTQQLAGLTAAYPACDFYAGDLACQLPAQRFQETSANASAFIQNTWMAGFGVGIVLGVPLVAREVEHGTARLAWTIGRSRGRWFLLRLAFVLAVAVVLLGVVSVVTELFAGAMAPRADLSQDFLLYGGRGPLVVARGLLGLGIGVLAGALLGRQLPALLLGLLATGLLYAGITFALDRWTETEAEATGPNITNVQGARHVGGGIELAIGEQVPYADSRVPEEMFSLGDGRIYASSADAEAGRNAIGREFQLVIPGERYPEIVARETAVMGGVFGLLAAAAALVIRQRRPV